MKQSKEKLFNNKILIRTFVGVATFGLALQVSASYRRVTGTQACRTATVGFNNSDQHQLSAGEGAWGFMVYPDNGYPSVAYCELPSDSELAHANFSTVRLRGYQASGGDIDFRACTYSGSSDSYDCGEYTDARSGDGHFTRDLVDLSPLNDHSSWYPVLWVDGLQAPSTVKGIYISG